MLSGCGAVDKTMKHSPANQAYDNLIRSAKGRPDSDALDPVNRFFNDRIRYASDFETWGTGEYWATPDELMEKGQGDCEDFAVAKFFTLREIGVEEDLLNLVYCRIAPGDRPHVVVGYLADADSPLILDSVLDEIVSASERSDLNLILGFNNKGLWVFKNGVRHKISTNSKRIRPWRECLQRMEAP
jgi:predicted transglutaminase-like cysteine proteinase